MPGDKQNPLSIQWVLRPIAFRMTHRACACGMAWRYMHVHVWTCMYNTYKAWNTCMYVLHIVLCRYVLYPCICMFNVFLCHGVYILYMHVYHMHYTCVMPVFLWHRHILDACRSHVHVYNNLHAHACALDVHACIKHAHACIRHSAVLAASQSQCSMHDRTIA